MSSTFLSQFNIDLLKNTLQTHLGMNIEFDEILINRIGQINTTIEEKNIKKGELKKYIFELNKKVIALVMNDIITIQRQSMQKHREEQRNKASNNASSNNASSHIFDTNKQLHLSTNTNVMERPRMQPNNFQKLDNKFNQMRDNRAEMFPKQQEIDFSDKISEDERPTNELYNTMLKQRENELKSTPIQDLLNRNEMPEPIRTPSISNNIKEEEVTRRVTRRETRREVVKIKNLYLDIDSRFRNLKNYKYSSNFQINFNVKNDIFIPELKVKGITIYNSKRIILNKNNIELPNNIKEIECIQAIVPLEENKIIFNNEIGLELDSTIEKTFNEPYLLLNINELKSKYKSMNTLFNNTFTKLIPNKINKNFVILKSSGSYEVYKDDINLEKLTLNLMKSNGKKYKSNNEITDVLSIVNYENNISIHLENNVTKELKIGDLLYFYDNSPDFETAINFHDNIRVKSINTINNLEYDLFSKKVVRKGQTNNSDLNNIINEYGKLFLLNLEVMTNIEDKKKIFSDVDMKTIFPELLKKELINFNLNQIINEDINEYIVLGIRVNSRIVNKYFKILGFNRRALILLNENNFNINKKDIMNINLIKDISEPKQNNNEDSLFYVGGHKIIGKKDDTIILDLQDDDNNYKNKKIFLIEHKKQINYTFRIGYL
jgi:hypothetical protein